MLHRKQRILWDQWHSIRYPPAYIPRDSLEVRNDILDWHGDHPHTNYHDFFDALRDAGLYLEVLGSPLTCFDGSQVPLCLRWPRVQQAWHLHALRSTRLTSHAVPGAASAAASEARQ